MARQSTLGMNGFNRLNKNFIYASYKLVLSIHVITLFYYRKAFFLLQIKNFYTVTIRSIHYMKSKRDVREIALIISFPIWSLYDVLIKLYKLTAFWFCYLTFHLFYIIIYANSGYLNACWLLKVSFNPCYLSYSYIYNNCSFFCIPDTPDCELVNEHRYQKTASKRVTLW